MVTHQLHIVGLPYGDIGDCMDEFLGQAVGKVVTLRPKGIDDLSGELDREASPACTYESLRAAQKSVPKLSAKVTLWNQFRDLSDVYRKQCDVAAFLLQKIGFTE